jgi:hypothetical protein
LNRLHADIVLHDCLDGHNRPRGNKAMVARRLPRNRRQTVFDHIQINANILAECHPLQIGELQHKLRRALHDPRRASRRRRKAPAVGTYLDCGQLRLLRAGLKCRREDRLIELAANLQF